MTILARLTFSAVALFFLCSFALTVTAEETGKYEQWQSADDRLEQMVNDLDQIVNEGTNAKAAHPEFLRDLQRTIDKYRIPKKIVYFSDDFTDNDFSNNPTWMVSAGEYTIDRYGRLFSSIAVSRPAAQEDTESETGGDRNLRILFGVLNELAKGEKDQAAAAEQAVIYSNAVIPNSFTMQFSFKPSADWGSTSIGVFQGDDRKSGYHLLYQASPSDGRPMQIIKYRYGKPYIIEEVIENSPNLDDGSDHILQFNRYSNGDMVISVDAKEILRTSDLTYRDDFTGVVIMNNGGSYNYDNIELYMEQ